MKKRQSPKVQEKVIEGDVAAANGSDYCCCFDGDDEGFDETDSFAGCDVGSRRH